MRRLLAGAAAVALLTACGSGGDVRAYLRDELGSSTRQGVAETWQSPDPVGSVTSRLVDAREPLARRTDAGSEYLRYDDDVVVVSGAAGGGSQVLAEGLDGRYRSGALAYLGPGFSPGSPAEDDGGPGDEK